MYIYKRKSIYFAYIAIWLLLSFHGCVDNAYFSDLQYAIGNKILLQAPKSG
jgi:hypothetical protein